MAIIPIRWVKSFAKEPYDISSRQIHHDILHTNMAVTQEQLLKTMGKAKTNLLFGSVSIKMSGCSTKTNKDNFDFPIKISNFKGLYFTLDDNLLLFNDTQEQQNARIDHSRKLGKSTTPEKDLKSRVALHDLTPVALRGDFNQKFKHTEQAIIDCISHPKFIKQEIFSRIKDYGYSMDLTIKEIVINFNSTRYVCSDCETSIRGFLHPESCFIKNIKAETHNYKCDDNMQVGVFISAFKKHANQKTKELKDHCECLNINDTPNIAYNDFTTSGMKDLLHSSETALYSYTVFMSGSHDKRKNHWEEDIAQLIIKEYYEMIIKGRNLIIPNYQMQLNTLTLDLQQQIIDAFADLAHIDDFNKAEEIFNIRDNSYDQSSSNDLNLFNDDYEIQHRLSNMSLTGENDESHTEF